MIKANELRIGNWMKESGPHGKKHFFQMTIPYLEALNDEPGLFDPIELTPEILEASGFEWHAGFLKKSLGKASMKLGFYAGVSDKMTLFQGTAPIDEGIFPNDRVMHFGTNHPTYLHQLQNLYFALAGEELKIAL